MRELALGSGLQAGRECVCQGGDFFSCLLGDTDTLVGKAGKEADLGPPQALGWPCCFSDISLVGFFFFFLFWASLGLGETSWATAAKGKLSGGGV